MPNKLKPHPSLSAACVGEIVISASGYQVIADDAPETPTSEGDQPVHCGHSLFTMRLTDAYYNHSVLFQEDTCFFPINEFLFSSI